MAIRNETLEVRYDAAGKCFSIWAQGRPAISDIRFGDAVGNAAAEAKVTAVSDKNFGAGQAIEMGEAKAFVFPSLPFALFRSAVRNSGSEAVVTSKVKMISLTTAMSASQTKTIGTGGLLAPETNTGSYAWLAIADPQSRNGVVAGWLTHDRGSGVVFSPIVNDRVGLEAQIDYGRLRVKPGGRAETETLAVGWFADARIGLESYADAIAKHYAVKLPPQPAGYCTWYADKHAGACDETNLAALAEFAAKELKQFGFDFVQIDDKWQSGTSKNGPCRGFMNAKPNGPYPNGMKATSDNIKKLGLMPGIWFMPFAGTSYDEFFKDHQDWFAKDKDGKPFEARWGGTCLDMTHPGAREYLKKLVNRIAHEWGYRVFKMDGLWTGTATRLMYVNNGYKWDEMGEAALSDPDKTQIEAFRDGLKLVRETAGPDVYLLGCCVSQNMRSFGGSFGLLDAMRVGPDTGAGRIGAPHASRNYFLQGRVWHNDPDCVSIRAKTPLAQARVNASFTAITGDLFYNSDWMPDLPPERLDILKRTILAHGLFARPVDYFENDPARIWLLTDSRKTPRRDVVAIFNWDQKNATTISCAAERIGLPASQEYAAFDFWENKFMPPFRGELRAALPPASCRVLAIRPAADHPQLLSTSRHVTQGIVDVIEEKWDAAAKTLSGVSRVVANDPCELRVIVPLGEKSWRAIAPPAVKQDGPKVRLAIASSVNAEVKWEIKFEPARIEATAPAAVTGLKAAAEFDTVTLKWDDNGADLYRIARNDGATFESSAAAFTDAPVAFGKTYRYSVTALGWGGAASAPASVEVAMPAQLTRPPAPPKPEVLLTSLKPVSAKNGYGQLGINKSIESKPLTVDGKQYANGLGAHANALFVYAIPSGARRFVSVVGLDDEKKDDPRSSVTFEVYGDVKEMGEQPTLLSKSPVLSSKTIRSWAFDLELNARYKELRLVITDAADGIASDHADIVDAGFIMK
ncbi:MAG: NPCBM/NEW2 domain-containing protein [Candidatus Sumerlaeota bacterium]|nr:NPCBM/NEW2 domain-containing protein [Candidatus Sumerlaeota bacterium]